MIPPLPPALPTLQDPLFALRHILPADLHAGGGPIALLQRPLPAPERAGLIRARGPRIADFTAGRSAARDALAECGLVQAVLPQSKNGPPVWPTGFTGSISHARGWALAVCGPLSLTAAVGLDIETLEADLDLSTIATRFERGQSADNLPARIFSAKEASYKAQFPLTERMLDFPDLEITFGPARRSYSRETGALLVTPFTTTIHPESGTGRGYRLEGQQVVALDMVISLVVVPAAGLVDADGRVVTPHAPRAQAQGGGIFQRSRAAWRQFAGRRSGG